MQDLLAEAGADTTPDPGAEWIGAVVRGDLERAARLRAEHPDVGTRDDDAETLPRWASAGDIDVVARLLDAGLPLDARGVDDGTALHYAGLWGQGSMVELLLARGADPELMAGPVEHPGTALGWTAWASRGLPGAAERADGYVHAAAALLAGGARVGEGMAAVAADEVAVLLEEAAARHGLVRSTKRSYARGRPVRVGVRERGGRVELDDVGGAVAIAGRPPGWREAAERTVAELGWNVTRDGVVGVLVTADRDIDALVRRTAEASLAVRDAILALED